VASAGFGRGRGGVVVVGEVHPEKLF
jgi:hypothetical protein